MPDGPDNTISDEAISLEANSLLITRSLLAIAAGADAPADDDASAEDVAFAEDVAELADEADVAESAEEEPALGADDAHPANMTAQRAHEARPKIILLIYSPPKTQACFMPIFLHRTGKTFLRKTSE